MRVLRLLLQLVAAYCLAVAVLVVLYRFIAPVTPLMVGQQWSGTAIERRWVPLERISPHLVRAVLVAEDARFCAHRGIDWKAVDAALGDGARRGASTITMQLAKNLFLWNGRWWVRKAVEAPIALYIDAVLPKRRILEIYLNVAEWGDGVFGIEAAARQQFGVSAAALSPTQAARLATMLPAPRHRSAAAPGPAHAAMADTLAARMGGADRSCLR